MLLNVRWACPGPLVKALPGRNAFTRAPARRGRYKFARCYLCSKVGDHRNPAATVGR
jgi:hypothetical protein